MTLLELEVPLTRKQVSVACSVHSRLQQWSLSDDALMQLGRLVPGFSEEACLLKSVAINSLYGTQIYAIRAMSDQVHRTLKDSREAFRPELVERMAMLTRGDGTKRNNISFASKFAHFFLSKEEFPIYDDVARKMVNFHLGRKLQSKLKATGDYMQFCLRFNYLAEAIGMANSPRDLDRYLWLVGQYRKWRDNKHARINVELVEFFRNPPPHIARKLETLVGADRPSP